MSQVKTVLKKLAPRKMLELRRKVAIARVRRSFGPLSRQQAFSETYREKLWGEDPTSPWSSGSGSVGAAADAYLGYLSSFIRENKVSSVVDLGCGDFKVGRAIAEKVSRYTGVDIVPDLVTWLQRNFQSPSTSFCCLDIVNDELPPGDLCLIRQVLQHLSNAEIEGVISKLASYKHVLVTEHYPCPNRLLAHNKDKPHGPDTRVVDGSAVFLDKPPFGLTGVLEVHRVRVNSPQVDTGETLRTFLLQSHENSAER